jgi:glycosyltransferase involved in cell wall biosynthesis
MRRKHLKICIVTESFIPSVGGQEFFVHVLATELTKRGHEVCVIAPKYSTRLLKRAGISKNNYHTIYKVHRLYSLPLGFLTRFSFFDWRFKFLIWPLFIWFYARREHFDVIHAHSIFPTATVCLIGKLLHIPLVVTSHGGDLQVQQNIHYGARLNAVSATFIKYSLKFVDKLIVTNFALKNLANDEGIPFKKIAVIPCFVDFDEIKIESSDLILNKIGLEKGKYLFYVGRMTPEKAILQFVKSMEKTLIKNNEPKLVLAGYGPEHQKIETYVKARNLERKVLFLGIVVGRNKWTLLKNSLAFVIPSTTEAFCMTAIEAMASGTVVIARNKSPFSEYIKDGVTGILLNDLKDVPEIIKKLNSDPEKRLRMINAAMQVAKNFSLERICSKYENIYTELL